jgi:uncharacterized protein (TIGR03435 family)
MQLLSSQPWVERLGWTLLHFLWQGALLGAAYALARRSPRPNTRYVLACVTLATMMAAPPVTWTLLRPLDVAARSTHLTDRAPLTASTGAAELAPVWGAVSSVQATQFLPWVVAAWFVGAFALWIRLIGAWLVVVRIRSTLVRPAPPEWQQTLNRLKARVGVTRPVRLLTSALVQTPAVIGWLRPVVLAPIGALAGLPSEQIEALLIHELAHIRRHDYLVNIVQSVAEALLFYHPAVWWVSGQIRTEREVCCDDIAVSLTGDAFTYASALAEIESSRPAHLPAVVAANGDSLADRIARLLSQSRPASRTLPGPGVISGSILLIVAAYGVFAQSTPAPQFEVASIKPNSGPALGYGQVRDLPGGRLATENTPLRVIIESAYGVRGFQILGGPGWVDSARFDVEAKAGARADRREVGLMLQSLLEERFKLKVHRESRELPVYALTAAKGGLKLRKPNAGGCAGLDTMPRPAGDQRPPNPCGITLGGSPSTVIMQGGNIAMGLFLGEITELIGRPVSDKTGVVENFDFRLEFTPDETTPALVKRGAQVDSNGKADPSASPSIFAALQQQLGLKLESTKGPVDVLVIDHVERPTEN